jgi:hypothetical protein
MYPAPWLPARRLMVWAESQIPAALLSLKLLLTLIAVVQLGLVFLLPGGRNAFLSLDLRTHLPHLTFLRSSNAFGFPGSAGPDGFVRYAIFAQNGTLQEGSFPNPRIQPDLRFSRWAAAGNMVSGDRPDMHAKVLRYLLEHLPSPPLKVDLFAGNWQLDAPAAGADGASARVRKLGTHDGLTQSWKPLARNGNK